MASRPAEVVEGIRIAARAVQLDVDAADAAASIRLAGAPLIEAEWVTPAYVEAAVTRERTFPTGLPTQPEAIAVPHADPHGVSDPAIAVLRLRSPVDFVEMATSDDRLAVRLVLLLALKSKDQARALGALIRAVQEPGLLDFLLSSTSPEAIAERMRDTVAAGLADASPAAWRL